MADRATAVLKRLEAVKDVYEGDSAERKIVLGKKSGLSSVVLKLEELGLNAPAGKHGDILNEVKSKATAAKRLMTDDEFRAVVAQYA